MEDSVLLECAAAPLGDQFMTFQRTRCPCTQGWRNMQRLLGSANRSPNNTASHSGRPESSITPL